jgi:hypothetical protein
MIIATTFSYFLIYTLIKPYTEKARLYISAINSLYLSLVATQTFSLTIPQYHSPALAEYITGYFAADLILGHIFDRKNLNVLTGYIHHSAFICLIWQVRATNETNLIYMFLPFEIPTLLLDLTRLYKIKALDYSFGASFFAFRIIYNIHIISLLSNYNTPYAVITTALLVLHIYWFRGWTIKTPAVRQ